MRFVDTNVLLYSASTVREERPKKNIARALLNDDDLALSVQVLQEFYVQATRAGKADRLTHEEAVSLVDAFMRYPVQEMTRSLMRASLDAKKRYRISYWDAAILEAARSLGCDSVLSEDLTDGEDYGGVKIENPFRSLDSDSGEGGRS
jgi:predicted nucleic acid-binding protein